MNPTLATPQQDRQTDNELRQNPWEVAITAEGAPSPTRVKPAGNWAKVVEYDADAASGNREEDLHTPVDEYVRLCLKDRSRLKKRGVASKPGIPALSPRYFVSGLPSSVSFPRLTGGRPD